MPIKAIRPSVEWAAEQTTGAASTFAQNVAAMGAHWCKHPDVAFGATNHDERFVSHVDAHKVAWLGDLVDPTEAEPAAHEDRLLLEGVELRVCVALARQVEPASEVAAALIYRLEHTAEVLGQRDCRTGRIGDQLHLVLHRLL